PQLIVALVGTPDDFRSNVAVSEDGGETWVTRSPVGRLGLELAGLALAPGSSDEIYVVGQPIGAPAQHFWRSADRGHTWVVIDGGLPKESYSGTLAVDPAGP